VAKRKTTTKTAKKAVKPKTAKKATTKASKASTKTKKRTTKKKAPKAKPTPDDPVAIDRRRKDRRESTPEAAPVVKGETRKVQRRRQIDPTTCERDYSDDEIEFMHALDDYKRANGRMFPTCSEILEVVRKIGYHKLDAEQLESLGRTNSNDEGDEANASENSASDAELELVGASASDSLSGSFEIE
jgi:hypothetical protein